MKLNNKGLSLVELIVAIAMSTIVVGAAAMFLYNAERSYRVAEYTVDLQMEAQILMEQMSNWVMDSNWVTVKNESTTDSVLVLYHLPRNKKKIDLSETSELATRIVLFTKDKKLYYKQTTEDVAGEYLTEIKNGGLSLDHLPAVTEKDIVGEYVNSFTIDFPYGVDEKRINSIIVTLGMSEGTVKQRQGYSVTNEFSIRNYLYDVGTTSESEGE